MLKLVHNHVANAPLNFYVVNTKRGYSPVLVHLFIAYMDNFAIFLIFLYFLSPTYFFLLSRILRRASPSLKILGRYAHPHFCCLCVCTYSSATSHSDVQYTESLWTIRHYVMRPTYCVKAIKRFVHECTLYNIFANKMLECHFSDWTITVLIITMYLLY